MRGSNVWQLQIIQGTLANRCSNQFALRVQTNVDDERGQWQSVPRPSPYRCGRWWCVGGDEHEKEKEILR